MLGARIASAVVLIPVVLLMIWFSTETTAVLVAVAAVIGTYEFYTMAAHAPRPFYPLTLAGYILAAFFAFAGYDGSLLLILIGTVIFALYTAVIIPLRDRTTSPRPANSETVKGQTSLWNWLLTVFAPIYAGVPLALLILIRHNDDTQYFDGWVLLALIGTWGTDTAAYFAGRMFGKHKLAPTISPKKTVEGAIGGVIFGVIATVIVGGIFLQQPWYLTIPLGLLIAIASIAGDLFESWVKRRFDTKDSGKLIPGHGGLLDRIDSFLAVSVLVYIFYIVSQKI